MLRPIAASEIEFYLHGASNISAADLDSFWAEIRAVCAASDIEIFRIEKERGAEQFEVSLCPSLPQKTIADTNQLKENITSTAARYDMVADFSAKPFADDFGSGLHIHIHLENEAGKNLFYKDNANMSDELAYSIGGLLAKMPEDMRVFAPTADSQKRFAAGSNAPLTVSWGANNRTTALRLPDCASDNKRIEHRVAGADANVSEVMAALLAAINYGLEHKIKPPPQVYGDASLAMYGLEKLI